MIETQVGFEMVFLEILDSLTSYFFCFLYCGNAEEDGPRDAVLVTNGDSEIGQVIRI